MKKLCLLLSLLLVVLSGCSRVPSEPLPKETEGNTEPVETAEEFLEADTQTTEPVIPQVSETTPWHLSIDPPEKWNMHSWDLRTYEPLVIPDDLKNYAIKVPLVHVEKSDGFLFKLEFFEEYYLLDAPIQVRITITNQTGEEVCFFGNNGTMGGFQNSDSGKFLSFKTHYPSQHPLDHYTDGYYLEEDVKRFYFQAEETITFERLYGALHTLGFPPTSSKVDKTPQCFFSPDASYVYNFTLYAYSEPFPSGKDSCGIEIPVEVVEVERID